MFQNIIEVLILSVIQGVSEFLPISSSAHLILVSSLYEFKSNSLLIDISLHLGSLLAIIYFFREELLDIKNNKRLLSLIVLGSIPLIVVGYILYSTNFIQGGLSNKQPNSRTRCIDTFTSRCLQAASTY